MGIKPQLFTNKPINILDEGEFLKDSNTWEFLTFEQMRAIRFIQTELFSDPVKAKTMILNLISSANHLETLLIDRINPSREEDSKEWQDYLNRKPVEFWALDKDVSGLGKMFNSDSLTQLKLVAKVEIWLRAMERYEGFIKKAEMTSFDYIKPDEKMDISKVK